MLLTLPHKPPGRLPRVSRALGLLLGFAADRVLGDPRRFHPVAGFGQVASRLEARWYDDSRAAGTGEAEVMAGLLEEKDIPEARKRLSHLCARDATYLEADELARATVESLAENTSDACVAPLLWGGVLGVPGLLGYRAANTLDAMVGYKSTKYLNFGWASARLDDVLNLVPARVCAVLTGLAAGRLAEARRIQQRDAAKHPSPNAGQVEAAFAGALDLQLGGTNSYGDYQEDRGTLGGGPTPTVADVRRTAALARRVGIAAAGVAAILALAGRRRGRRWS